MEKDSCDKELEHIRYRLDELKEVQQEMQATFVEFQRNFHQFKEDVIALRARLVLLISLASSVLVLIGNWLISHLTRGGP